jgi:membrane protease YdiL (CAAX protease family)
MDVRPPRPDEISDAAALDTPALAGRVAETAVGGFCRYCGMPRDPSSSECPACAARTAASATGSLSGQRDHEHALRSVLGLYFALLATSAVGLLLPQNGSRIDFLVEAVDTVIVAIWIFKDRAFVWSVLRRVGSGKWYALAFVLAAGTFLLAETSVRFIQWLVGVETLEIARPLLDAGFGFGWVLLVGCVQPAVVEELAFRGILLGRMQLSISARQAILVSALLFAILHLSIPSFGHLLVIGLCLGYLRVKSGSLYPCVLMHFAHNAMVITAEVL